MRQLAECNAARGRSLDARGHGKRLWENAMRVCVNPAPVARFTPDSGAEADIRAAAGAKFLRLFRDKGAMKHAGTRSLYAYWNTLRGARRAPTRREIDPMQIARLLPDVLMLDCRDDGMASVRLAGTRVCTFFGTELRGSLFSDLWDAGSAGELEHVTAALADEAACAVLGASGHAYGDRSCEFEGLVLPLDGDRAGDRHMIAILSATQPALPHWFGNDVLRSLSLTSHRLTWPSGRMQAPQPVAAYDLPALVHAGARKVGRFIVYDGGQACVPSHI
jgi:hypothetical protein